MSRFMSVTIATVKHKHDLSPCLCSHVFPHPFLYILEEAHSRFGQAASSLVVLFAVCEQVLTVQFGTTDVDR